VTPFNVRRRPAAAAGAMLLAALALGEGTAARSAPPPPVIDVHVHSTITKPQDLARLDALNVRYWILGGLLADLRTWTAVDSRRFLPALVFPCDRGRAPVTGRSCFDTESDLPDPAWLRAEIAAGRIKALGEMSPQYLGMSLADTRLDPFWALAEEFDLPVVVHSGTGPRGAAYASSPMPFKSPNYRVALGDPLLLEEVLLRHKRLRMVVAHAGWPWLASTIALLYAHPGVYVDVAALQTKSLVPRAAYYRHLHGLVEAGFATRILFGSDFPDQLGEGIDAIRSADFLSPDEKADVLCRNAVRFLRLDGTVCLP
jgi:Amidohydrolase